MAKSNKSKFRQVSNSEQSSSVERSVQVSEVEDQGLISTTSYKIGEIYVIHPEDVHPHEKNSYYFGSDDDPNVKQSIIEEGRVKDDLQFCYCLSRKEHVLISGHTRRRVWIENEQKIKKLHGSYDPCLRFKYLGELTPDEQEYHLFSFNNDRRDLTLRMKTKCFIKDKELISKIAKENQGKRDVSKKIDALKEASAKWFSNSRDYGSKMTLIFKHLEGSDDQDYVTKCWKKLNNGTLKIHTAFRNIKNFENALGNPNKEKDLLLQKEQQKSLPYKERHSKQLAPLMSLLKEDPEGTKNFLRSLLDE